MYLWKKFILLSLFKWKCILEIFGYISFMVLYEYIFSVLEVIYEWNIFSFFDIFMPINNELNELWIIENRDIISDIVEYIKNTVLGIDDYTFIYKQELLIRELLPRNKPSLFRYDDGYWRNIWKYPVSDDSYEWSWHKYIPSELVSGFEEWYPLRFLGVV